MNQLVVGDKGCKTTEVTVLYRKNGTWEESEVGTLVSRLSTQSSESSWHSEYVLLLGHYDKPQISAILSTLGEKIFPFSVDNASIGDEGFPFEPHFLGT